MSARTITDLSRLCIHTITTKPWSIEEAIRNFSAAGVKGITVWRDALDKRNIADIRTMIADHGMEVVSLCRGGFFCGSSPKTRQAAVDDNLRAIDQAAALGTDMVVLVCGADPTQLLEESREQIRDGVISVLPHAVSAKVRLAIEPLHPMYADSRSAINTLRQANDMAVSIASPFVGVAVDVYHLWWDPDLEEEIRRCATNKHLFAFHICDWKVPTTDLLLDRALMGEGCIPVKRIRGWVEDTGFAGYNEVEIFSTTYWNSDQSEFLKRIIHAYKHNS